jgi:hypothetical protein
MASIGGRKGQESGRRREESRRQLNERMAEKDDRDTPTKPEVSSKRQQVLTRDIQSIDEADRTYRSSRAAIVETNASRVDLSRQSNSSENISVRVSPLVLGQHGLQERRRTAVVPSLPSSGRSQITASQQRAPSPSRFRPSTTIPQSFSHP